ncbi:MAG: hypothetical protein QME57_04305, partial [Patescibacteria group bacterium]|nr:hypothetical protein [Patescibacteria group bacterium]
QILDYAERTPSIYASHSKCDLTEYNIDYIDTVSEYTEQYCTFLVEFIKHWMIDNEEIEFTGEITDYGFGVVGNKNNPTSKSMCKN